MFATFFGRMFGWIGRMSARSSVVRKTGKLVLACIEEPVEVYFDESGVPHVFARSGGDAAAALGWLHASERLWQMEFIRRLTRGTSSEVFGERPLAWESIGVAFRDKTTVDLDRFMRTLGLLGAAEAGWNAVSAELRAEIEAYVKGVNEVVLAPTFRFPIEFRMLRYHPEPWTAIDTLLVGKAMAFQLNFGWKQLLFHAGVEARLSGADDLIRSLYPPAYGEGDPRVASYTGSVLEGLALRDAILSFAGWSGSSKGSNAWVVSGAHTESGSPILASDPHLALTSPNLFYLAELSAPSLHVAGATLPGAPSVLLGHNDHLAWGMTNVMAHDTDFYVETIDPEDPLRYKVGDEWADVATREEAIRVKDEEYPRHFTVRTTRHGPLVSDVVGGLAGPGQALAMKWVATCEASGELDAIRGINRATSWDSFVEAQRTFACPAQNTLYADREGNIGYTLMGWIPKRPAGDSAGSKPAPHLHPLPGAEGQHEWQGYVPFEVLPRLENPESGRIVSANQEIVAGDYPYFISAWWEPPYRARRIHQLLDQSYLRPKDRKPLTVEQMMEFQLDVVSVRGPELCEELLSGLIEKALDLGRIPHKVSQILLRWDGGCGPSSRGATCFHVFYDQILRRVFRPRLGEALYLAFVENWNQAFPVVDAILRDPDSLWFAPQGRNDVVLDCLERASRWLCTNLGDEPVCWAWGDVHSVTLRHALHGVPLARPLLSQGPFPGFGSGTTINMGEFSHAHPFEQIGGPAYRQVIPCGDWDRAVFIMPGGQSGSPGSKHFDDLMDDYLKGIYREMHFGERAVKKDRTPLLLEPERTLSHH